jgi:DNA-binding transcriptional MerR regulator
MSNLRIGELSAKSGRSVHAIRWYEAQGLIPGVVRDAGGRRVYNALHVDWLDLMDQLRRTGMSVAEMRAYTALVRQGRATLKERQQMLQSHRERVLAKIAEWTAALRLIDGKIDFYGEWLSTGHRPKGRPADRVKEAGPVALSPGSGKQSRRRVRALQEHRACTTPCQAGRCCRPSSRRASSSRSRRAPACSTSSRAA